MQETNKKTYLINELEEWKYTNKKYFQKLKFNEQNPTTVNNNNTILKNKLSIINNREIKNHKKYNNLSIGTIKTALENKLFNCKEIFNNIAPQKNEFIKYNTENYRDGIYMYIKENSNIEEPININSIVNERYNKSFLNYRYLFSFGKNVTATIIIKDINKDINYINTVYEMFLEKNTTIDIIFESENPQTTQLTNFASTLNKNSTLNIYVVDISGKLIKKNYLINLKEKNTTCNYKGINLIRNNDHIDNYIQINHQNQYTTSAVDQKNILDEKSKSIFYSKTIIHKNCLHSEAYQNNNNIMLSSNANAYSNPQLEIYNNDVKCAHGSTTGTLDQDMLFYMQSRGIGLKDSKKMLLSGFINHAFKSLDKYDFASDLNHKINLWLNNVN